MDVGRTAGRELGGRGCGRPPRRAGGDGGSGRAAARRSSPPRRRPPRRRPARRPAVRSPSTPATSRPGNRAAPTSPSSSTSTTRSCRTTRSSLSTESNSPIVAEGDQDRTHGAPPRRPLPDLGPLARPQDVGQPTSRCPTTRPRRHADAHGRPHRAERRPPAAAGQDPRLRLRRQRLDQRRAGHRGGAALQGFKVGLEEQTHSAVTVDYNNNPLCGGVCLTATPTASSQIDDLGPATYFIDVHPPDAARATATRTAGWYQTTTIDGGLQLHGRRRGGQRRHRRARRAAVGAAEQPHRLLVRLRLRAAAVRARRARGEITGHGPQLGRAGRRSRPAPSATRSRTRSSRCPTPPPTAPSSSARATPHGNFDIQNVPAGTYNLAIWDEQLSYIMRFKPVTVAAGQTVDVNDDRRRRRGRASASRAGSAGSTARLQGPQRQRAVRPGRADCIANTDMDQRWRDGSIKEATFTDPTGYYEYPTAEGGALGRWIINEQGFARFSAYPGAVGARRAHRRRDAVLRVEPPARPGQPVRPDRPGRRPADQPAAARGPPRHGRLGQARLPGRARPARSSASPTSRRPATSSTRGSRRTRTTSRPSRT